MAVTALPIVRRANDIYSTYGRATLVNGAVTIPNVYVDVTTKIFITYAQRPDGGGRIAAPYNVVPGVSFDIVSTANTDNNDVYWMMLVEPNIVQPSNYGYPQLDRGDTYGSAQLVANFVTIATPYARTSSTFIVCVTFALNSQATDAYYIAAINNGASFTIGSTNQFDADISVLNWFVISPSGANLSNGRAVSYPQLLTGGSQNNYNVDQLVSGTRSIVTTSASNNVIALYSAHTFASTPANTGVLNTVLTTGPSALNFTSSFYPADDQRFNWWIINPTDGSP